MDSLQKELTALKEKVAELESRIAAEPVAKWQPKGGYYCVHADGYVRQSHSTKGFRLNGVERETQAQAQRAAVEMRRFNRLLALRDELCGDDVVFNWSDDIIEKYIVLYDHNLKQWQALPHYYLQSTNPYFTTKEAAQKACDMLNSGEVEL